jgi:Protein of unknown function (DUF1640)
MANQKAITELPRFLLPRITWSQVAAKGAASQLRPNVRPNHNRPAPPPSHHLTQRRTLHTTPPPRQLGFHPFQRPTFCEEPTRKLHNHVPANAPPIRHNGVYVAAFKPAKRAFSTSQPQQKDHHFDTLKFVQRLKSEGFREEQAVAMMRVLNDVIEESIQNLTRTMVLKEGAYQMKTRQRLPYAPPAAADTRLLPQTPNEAPTRKKSTLPNSAPSS